ncbi:hypothetical protein V8B97DRAFT_1999166 [Scleroderma yunnanense]
MDDIQLLNDYFAHQVIDHFPAENSDCITKYSSLHGAVPGSSIPEEVIIPGNEEELDNDINNSQLEAPHQADEFERLNNKGKDRDHQFNCEIIEGGCICNRLISFNSCKEHLMNVHNIPKEAKVCCPW